MILKARNERLLTVLAGKLIFGGEENQEKEIEGIRTGYWPGYKAQSSAAVPTITSSLLFSIAICSPLEGYSYDS